MTQAHLLIDIGEWLVNIAFFTSALFPVVTALFWPWWESWWGRNIVSLEACIAATLLRAVLKVDFGIDDIGLLWVSTAAFTLVIAVVVWRAVLIWRTQRQGLGWHPQGHGKRDRRSGPSFSRFSRISVER